MNLKRTHLIRIGSLAVLAIVGFDFFLHAGLLNRLYDHDHPFFLPAEQAFMYVPLGYLAFVLLTVLLMWLMIALNIHGGRDGAAFGLKLGGLSWGALVLGLISIANAPLGLLAGWFVGQTLELGLAGWVVGTAFESGRMQPLLWRVVGFVLVCFITGVVLQNI